MVCKSVSVSVARISTVFSNVPSICFVTGSASPLIFRSVAETPSASSTFILSTPVVASVRSSPSPLALIDAVTPEVAVRLLIAVMTLPSVVMPSPVRSIVVSTPLELMILNLPGATPLPPL